MKSHEIRLIIESVSEKSARVTFTLLDNNTIVDNDNLSFLTVDNDIEIDTNFVNQRALIHKMIDDYFNLIESE